MGTGLSRFSPNRARRPPTVTSVAVSSSKRTGRLIIVVCPVAPVEVSVLIHNCKPPKLYQDIDHRPVLEMTVIHTRVRASLPDKQLSFNRFRCRRPLSPFSVSPEYKPPTLGLVVEVSRICPHTSDSATVACASTLTPALDAPTMHAHFPHAADPLVPTPSFGMDNLC